MSLSVCAAAREVPEGEALVCDGERLTFAALAQRVQARRVQFTALGVQTLGARPVALIVDGSTAMFECIYLCFELGLPLLPLHPRLTAPEREYLIGASSAQCTIDPALLESIGETPATVADFPPVPDERALALVPSSGSTGRPKLVELSRRAFFALCRADAERVAPRVDDRALLCLPLSHVGGLSVVTRALSARRCCVAFRARSGGLLASMAELAQCLVAERITLLSLVPPVLARLVRDAPEIASQAPLRAILLGGQACSAELFAAARARALPVLTSYGLTEACSQVSTLALPLPEAPPLKQGVVGVGFPLPGVEVRIVRGSIEVRGPTLFSGYLGQGAAPLDDDGFFKTGDRGEFDPERGLFVFGRESELIISGGENVDPSEVEHALLACTGVEAAMVFGVPDPEFGEQVAAALECRPGIFDEQALFASLDQRLASFKQPRALCCLEALPRLASGKLDRPQIRARATPELRPAQRAPRFAKR